MQDLMTFWLIEHKAHFSFSNELKKCFKSEDNSEKIIFKELNDLPKFAIISHEKGCALLFEQTPLPKHTLSYVWVKLAPQKNGNDELWKLFILLQQQWHLRHCQLDGQMPL